MMTLQVSHEKICFALNSPLRCWIIQLLKSHKTLSPSDLASLMHISLNRCYYHLENLEGLIKKDKQNRYILTEEGIRAFHLLAET